MSILIKHKDTEFGIGDKIKIYQNISEFGKKRSQVFEGIVIKIKGRDIEKTFTVRRIGVNQIGIEKIFPINSPSLEKIIVSKKGVSGIRRSKLYFLRNKSKREIEKIYKRINKKKAVKSSK